MFRILDTAQKIEGIEDKMKRTFYNGKPTRKYNRLLKIHQNTTPYYDLLRRKDGL